MEVFKSELQLVGIQPFGAPAKLAALQLLNDEPEAFDLRLRRCEVDAFGRERPDHPPQRVYIIWQSGKIDVHELEVYTDSRISSSTIGVLSQSVAALSRHRGSPLPLGCAPVDAVNQHRQLHRVQHQPPTRLDVRRPEEDAVLEPRVEEAEACASPEHNFEEVGVPTPEHEEMAREGILPQHALDQHREPIDALAHVDEAEGQMYLHARRKKLHDARSSLPRVASKGPSATSTAT